MNSEVYMKLVRKDMVYRKEEIMDSFIGHMIPIESLAYIAGFLDGEGCIRGNSKRGVLEITITNTIRAPLEFIWRIFGGNTYEQKPRKANHKKGYMWRLQGEPARKDQRL